MSNLLNIRRRLILNAKTSEPYDMLDYMTICAYDDSLSASFSQDGLEYCLGDGVWIPLAAGKSTPTVGELGIISFRGNFGHTISGTGIGRFTFNGRCALWGNCMSLLFGDEGKNSYSLAGYESAFRGLFLECSQIMSVSSGFLPATTLAEYCYNSMFRGCTSLTTAPELPATTLAEYCYSDMFNNCTSLTTAPELPATNLADNCYSGMFYNCNSLETAPALPATTLADYCYANMFYGCRKLTTAPELPATTLANHCYEYMFHACKGLTTAPQLPATTLCGSCYRSMFNGCTSLKFWESDPTEIFELPATSGYNNCYQSMFEGCTNIDIAPRMTINYASNYSCESMFYNCTKLSDASLVTINDASGEMCCASMFYNTMVAAPPQLNAICLGTSCYYGMF